MKNGEPHAPRFPFRRPAGRLPRRYFAGVTAALAGTTPRAQAVAEALADVLGMTGVQVRDEDRAAYHAAASIAANFLVTLEGITYLLDAGVSNGTAIGTWYVSPFSGNYTPVSGLTAATYPTDATEFTSYTGNRKTYVDGGVSAGAMDNSASKASFAITGSATLYGAALLSVATKSSTGGKCLAAANFSPTRAVVNTDTLDVQYNLSGSST